MLEAKKQNKRKKNQQQLYNKQEVFCTLMNSMAYFLLSD